MELPSPVFSTLRLNQNGPLFLDSHVNRLKRAYVASFGTDLKIDPVELDSSLKLISQDIDLPCLVRIEVHIGGGIVMVPRILDIYPSSINLSTQPLPQGNVASPRYKQGDWKAYFETRKNAIMSGSDAALLVHDDSIVDGDTFTPLFAFQSGEIAVPDPMMGAVESITLGKILEFLGKRIKVKQRKISLYEISNCADAIAVGTGMGIRRIASIDDITIPTDLEAGLEYILCEAEDMGFMEGHADAEWEH